MLSHIDDNIPFSVDLSHVYLLNNKRISKKENLEEKERKNKTPIVYLHENERTLNIFSTYFRLPSYIYLLNTDTHTQIQTQTSNSVFNVLNDFHILFSFTVIHFQFLLNGISMKRIKNQQQQQKE